MTTRITAGEWRGRVIDTPPGGPMRPTRSMVRQALFNILRDDVPGSAVADLYAGAGSVGFEALSRGAEHVTFVERDRMACRLIAGTAERLGCADRVEVVARDAVAWLRSRPPRLLAAGICFIDAPYRDTGLDDALELLGAAGPAIVVCEHHHRRSLPPAAGGLVRVRESRYGLTGLTIYRRT